MLASRILTRLTCAALLAAALAPRAGAQCMRDGFDSAPCCTPVIPALPVFPAVTQQIKYVCFNTCQIALQGPLCVTMSAPTPAMLNNQPVCGVYIINFQIRRCANNQLVWRGNLRAHYARNWQEFDPVTTRGVWRFLLNGDMTCFLPAIAGPNQRPPCVGQFGGVAYFSGYVDYAYDCLQNTWLSAFALNHECDFTTHAPGTARPLGSSHPTRSYVFVGPAAGFVVDPANGPWTSGGITGESIRKNDWPNAPNLCLGEEFVLAPGIINPVNLMCECLPIPPGAPTQFGDTFLQVAGGCGSRFDTMNPPIGPFPFTQKAIGYWTNFLTFPSPSHLFIDHGTTTQLDGCTGQPATQYLEGVTTLTSGVGISSYTAGQFLGNNIVDLGTSNGVGGGVIVGKPHVTWYLLSLNY